MGVLSSDCMLPDFLGSFFTSTSSLTLMSGPGDASTFVAGMSTVTVDWDAVRAEDAWDWVLVELAGAAGPGGVGIGKGKGDPGEKAPLSNGLFCVFTCPIMVLKACCIAYFWKKIKKCWNCIKRVQKVTRLVLAVLQRIHKRFGLTERVLQLQVKFEGEKTCSFYSDNKPLLSLDMAPNMLQLVELKWQTSLQPSLPI